MATTIKYLLIEQAEIVLQLVFLFRNVHFFQKKMIAGIDNSDKMKHELYNINTSQLRSINSSYSTFQMEIVSDAHYFCGNTMKVKF